MSHAVADAVRAHEFALLSRRSPGHGRQVTEITETPGPAEPGATPPRVRRRLSLGALRDPSVLALLAPDDAAAAARLLGLIDRLSRDADRLGPAALLELALAETGYTAAIAGGLFGEQAVANVERLMLLAQSAERASAQPGGPLRTLLARLESIDSSSKNCSDPRR